MNINKTIGLLLLALSFFSSLAFADVELKGTVVKLDRAENRLILKTERGEETLLIDKATKGLDIAKEGAAVTVKFTEKGGEPKVIEIVPQKAETREKAPR